MPKSPKTIPHAKLDALSKDAPMPQHVLDYLHNYKPLADGVYIGLSNARYHADTAIGSTNLRDVMKGPNVYWTKSWMNPKRAPDKQTPAKILGTAVHELLLEGAEVFEKNFVRGPYGPNDDHLSASEKGQMTKEAKKKLMVGQELLAQEDYDFVLGCKEVLDADPDLAGCLDNGLSEVSVFWTREDGVRCKARLDKHKRRGIGDIKTIANERERPLAEACCLDIHTYRYDIPAELYMEGRARMGAFVADGRVFLGDEAEQMSRDNERHVPVLDFLTSCDYQRFGFQFVFIPKTGAPDAWSCTLSPGNQILSGARQDIETAIAIYRASLDKFGVGRRWLPGHAVGELDVNMLPVTFGRRMGAAA